MGWSGHSALLTIEFFTQPSLRMQAGQGERLPHSNTWDWPHAWGAAEHQRGEPSLDPAIWVQVQLRHLKPVTWAIAYLLVPASFIYGMG